MSPVPYSNAESPIPLPEFLVYLPEPQLSTTEHPGPLSEPLVSSLNPRPDGPLGFPRPDEGRGC